MRIAWRVSRMRGLHSEAHLHAARAILDGDRALGSEADGFSHAVAANVLARTTPQLVGEAIARDASEVLESLRVGLTAQEQVEAERRGRAWTQRYPEP